MLRGTYPRLYIVQILLLHHTMLVIFVLCILISVFLRTLVNLTTFHSAKQVQLAAVIRRSTSYSDCTAVWTSKESWFEFSQRQETFRPVISASLLCSQYREFQELKQPGCEADYSPHLVSKFNEWSYTSTSLYAFMTSTGTALLYEINIYEQHNYIGTVYWFLFKSTTSFGWAVSAIVGKEYWFTGRVKTGSARLL
jgi:hypothetical protein